MVLPSSKRQRLSTSSEKKHIQFLLAIFIRRVTRKGFSYIALGLFLEMWFSGSRLKTIQCRHTLTYQRPDGVVSCQTTGTAEPRKAAGVRVSSVKSEARKWLKTQALLGDKRFRERPSDEDLAAEEADDGCTLESDLESESETQTTFNQQDFPSSQIAVNVAKPSTKLRVCHLAIILQQFRQANGDLEKEAAVCSAIQQLVDENFMVLHSCGCGLYEKGACVEPTHLRFGSRDENDLDRHLHVFLEPSSARPPGHESSYKECIKHVRNNFPGSSAF